MPYLCEVVRVDPVARTVVLHVTPEQPDAEPFYTGADVAAGLLAGDDDNALGTALGGWDGLEAIARGGVDVSRFVVRVDVRVIARARRYGKSAPVAAYTIEVADAAWLRHLRPGARYDSHAYSDDGPHLVDADVFDPDLPRAPDALAVGARVAIRAELAPSPGALCGRGVIERAARATHAPRGWAGGLDAYLVALDHGPRAWVFAETARIARADRYERAWADATAWSDDLLAQPPRARAEAFAWLAIQGGGTEILPPEGARTFAVGLPSRAVRLYGLARRLPHARAIDVLGALIAGWLADEAGLAYRLPAELRGIELADGERLPRGAYLYFTPLELAIGALALVLATPPTALPPGLARRLAPGLAALEGPRWLGTSPSVWTPVLAYLRAASAGVPPPLPDRVIAGRPYNHAEAAALGLAGGALVTPSDADRFER